jgi:hypothetical protein
MSRATVILCLLVFATISASADDRLLLMKVGKPATASVSAGNFDQMAVSAGLTAKTRDDPSDVSCGLSFARSGDVVENTTLPKEITKQSQLDKIATLPVDVFVMDQLSVCGIHVDEPAVVGCERPGPILVESGSLAHLTLIHEAGHRANLRHSTPRAQCEDDDTLTLAPLAKKNNIMFCTRHAMRKLMTTGDCNKMVNMSDFDPGDADLQVDMGEANLEQAQLPSVSPTQELLFGLFGEGINFGAIAALTEAQLEAIREELRGDDHRFWEQAAYVLGIRGNADDLQAIVALAHRAANIPTPEGYRARSAVPEAIGLYLAFHKGDASVDWAKTFLLANVPAANSRAFTNSDDETLLLANRYAQGAALSGDIGLAQSAIDLLATQQVDLETQARVATRALAAQSSDPEAVMNNAVPVAPDALETLRQQSSDPAIDINPEFVDVLRREGLTDTSTIVNAFSAKEFGPGVVDLELLDQRVEELLLEKTTR